MSPPKMHHTVRVFYSYAHEDEQLRKELVKHLNLLQRQGVIQGWHDRQIDAGTDWAEQINENLDAADIILLLVSADFLASDYCWSIEMTRALERHKAKEVRVIPVILRPVDWEGAPFSKLQALPENAKPVTTWANQDEAFQSIAQGIGKVARNISAHP